MSRPRVSIILPVYNAASTLAEAIRSVQDQTFTDWELIVHDDGSMDASPRIAAEFAAQDPRIRPVTAEHRGIVAALQQACAHARGDFLARMDADDRCRPQRLARQLEMLEADPEAALCGAGVVMSGDSVGLGRRRYETWINRLLTHEDIVRELFVECPIAHPTFFLRRGPFEAVGGYRDAGWAEDYDLCMRLFEAGFRFAKVSEPLLEWRESAGRLSMIDPRYSPASFRALKRHYLFRTYLRDRPFHQWGAGEVGKTWLREWGSRAPRAVVDINPRKIGRAIHGFPVIAPDDLPGPGRTFTVVAVGAPGARDEIRAWFSPRGYRELEDYLFLA